MKFLSRKPLAVGAALLISATTLALNGGADASSHRDAPLIAEDPVADNTDVYAFISPDAPDHVTLISNFIPLQEPAGGPNFHSFGDDVLYEINIDNDGDAAVEVSYQFRFTTTVKDDSTPLYNEGTISYDSDNQTYTNLNVEQSYTLTEVANGVSTQLASGLVAPANIGPRSTPNYPALAGAAIKKVNLTEGQMRVFAGPRDEAFPVDLGSIFDLGGLRPLNGAHVAPLDATNGVNSTDGFNVHSIAIQVPKARIVTNSEPVIGVHSAASRFMNTVRGPGTITNSGSWVQISRLGNPLVNEVVVPLSSKNVFNGTVLSPGDSAFQPIVEDPRLGQLLPVLYPDAFTCYPTTPRSDLVTIYLTGIPGVNQPSGVVGSEQLRLNTSVTPTAFDEQKPMGLLAGQADGFPNGRRIGDDVVDISLQAVAGATAVGSCNGKSPNNQLGDGAVGNDKPYLTSFPYLPHPHVGFDHDHDHTTDDDPVTKSRSHTIQRLYLAFFHREADEKGLNYWIDDPSSLNQVANYFATSNEFINRYGNLNNEMFVERVYMNVLGRSSDPKGKAYWLGLINSGELSRGEMMLYFADSAEFIATVS